MTGPEFVTAFPALARALAALAERVAQIEAQKRAAQVDHDPRADDPDDRQPTAG